MPLFDYKIHLELNWTKNCVMHSSNVYTVADNNEAIFEITNTKLYVSIVPLPTKANVKLTKQLNEGFKRPGYWN